MPELRVETDDLKTIGIIDGFCQGTGTCRTKLIMSILKSWADAKAHEATVICRVAGINPTAPETNRREG